MRRVETKIVNPKEGSKQKMSIQEKGLKKIVQPGERSKQKLSIQEKGRSKNCQSRRRVEAKSHVRPSDFLYFLMRPFRKKG